MQILEDGRLTDSQGHTVNFKNTVIIMTSNVGSQILERLGATDLNEAQSKVRDALREYFRPEFLNRIDEIIFFGNLSQEALGRIVDLQLKKTNQRLAERKITLELDTKAREFLAREGFEPAYGARPLRRAIQRHLLDPLSLMLLEGKYKEGDTIRVTIRKDGSSLSIGE